MEMEGNQPAFLPTKDGYDLWSLVYDEEQNPLVLLEEPHVDRLLEDVQGLSVLDVGCGTGRHAIRLGRAGAKVTGIDFSPGMMTKARQKAGAEKITLVEHDIHERLPFDAGTFDRVLCCLVLDHIGDLASFFSELRRVCRDTGYLVASVMHPAMMLKGVQARFHDPTTGTEVRPASCPNQVSDYVMAALNSGLRFLELSEHAVDASLVARTDRAARYIGWPMLLLMKLAPDCAASRHGPSSPGDRHRSV